MKIINENEFDSTVEKGLVLVDFFANWCGPCKMLSPILEKLSTEYEDVEIVKVDIDKSQQLALQHQVQSIPTLLLFKDGKIVSRNVGFLAEAQLKSLLDQHRG